jgi:pimeloyl-ACP methyl ester carboxylesterase
MADDIAALIDHLGLDRPDLVGYSLGGWVALHTAAKYPAKVARLVAASANTRPDAIYPEMRVQQGQVNAAAAEFLTDTPMYQLYQRVAPRPRTSVGCWTRLARRWPRISTSTRRSEGSRCRP